MIIQGRTFPVKQIIVLATSPPRPVELTQEFFDRISHYYETRKSGNWNTNSLNKYLQGKDIDVSSAFMSAKATMNVLQKCRSDEDFSLVWQQANALAEEIKEVLENTKYQDLVEFKGQLRDKWSFSIYL